MAEPIVINCAEGKFTLAIMATMLDVLSQNGSVTLVNCTGGDMLELGMHLMAHYERIRDQK